MSNKVIKSVSFNVTNKEDEIMLKAIKKRNFSGYVKKLIMADLDAKRVAKETILKPVVEVFAEVEVEEKVNSIEELKKRSLQNKKRQNPSQMSSAPNVFRPNN